MTEAEKPRPLPEHMARAHQTYDKIAEFIARNGHTPLAAGQLAQLRYSAAAGFWLFPLVEARRGALRI